jgi:hypothetical protein
LSLYHITKQDSRYWGLCRDFTLKCIRLDCFFITEPGRDLLMCLDQALQHRSVSVTSDEPLCISTWLGLDISQVLKYSNHDDRMEEMWTLISEKFRGIPAGVAFFEDNTRPSQGWRWAPRSLLQNDNSSITTFQRTNRWHQGKSAVPTSSSLRVKSSGFLLKQKHYRDGLPLHPWPGVRTRDESRVLFRDGNGTRFAIHHSFRSQQWGSLSTQTRRDYYEKHKRPISRAILQGGCAVVLVNRLRDLSMTVYDRTRDGDDSLLVSRKDHIEGSEKEL